VNRIVCPGAEMSGAVQRFELVVYLTVGEEDVGIIIGCLLSACVTRNATPLFRDLGIFEMVEGRVEVFFQQVIYLVAQTTG